MKILYRPFGIIAGIIGARLARKVFTAVWGTIDHEAPPRPSTEHTTLPKVIAAAVVEAATSAATRAAVDRASLKWFHFLTGIWAGEKEPGGKKKKEDEDG
jgi:hypothetical protein